MTLERHRSKMMSGMVDYTPDGTLTVTDLEGTFPMRGGKKQRTPISNSNNNHIQNGHGPYGLEKGLNPPNEYYESSYLSYDPKRDVQRKYKPQERSNQYGEALADMGYGTVGSGGSQSLQRKMRRMKGTGSTTGSVEGGDRRHNRFDTLSSAGRERRRQQKEDEFRAGGGYCGSLQRSTPRGYSRSQGGSQRGTKSLDMDAIKAYRASKRGQDDLYDNRKSAIVEMYKSGRGLPMIREVKTAKERRLAEERLPGVVFLVSGLILLALGATKLIICWWHEYYCLLWTGFLLLSLGICGATHAGEYLTKWRNGTYILLGWLSAGAVMASCGLLLQVIPPIITEIAKGTTVDTTMLDLPTLAFTNTKKSLVISLPNLSTMVYLNLGLDLAGFLLCLISFFSLTATMVAIGNHWDARYLVTGECDHRGHPRAFNPLEQMAMGQSTMIIGIIVTVLWVSESYEHYYLPIWAPVLVPLAALFSFFFGKRPDKKGLGWLSLFFEFVAIGGLTVACIFVLLGLLDDIEYIQKNTTINPGLSEAWAAVVAEGLFTLFVFINLIFVIGISFNTCRKLCCPSCAPWAGMDTAPVPVAAPASSYKGSQKGSKRNSASFKGADTHHPSLKRDSMPSFKQGSMKGSTQRKDSRKTPTIGRY